MNLLLNRSRAILILLFFSLLSPVTAAAQITVTSANPNNASQGTVNLDVTVTGNGFKKGAKAQWLVSGTTNPGGITVNSTTVVSSTQITANITAATDAIVGGFDIVVRNSDGRTGKGTELFAINQNATGAKFSCPTPAIINPPTNACTSNTAQTSCTDGTFGNSGLDSIDTGVEGDSGRAVLQQTDGKLVLVGMTGANGVMVQRYNVDGSLDPTFGVGGIVRYTFSGTTSMQDNGGALDSAGNILAFGFEAGTAFVIRFTPTGALDNAFGSGGVFLFNGYGYPRGIALQPDGKIVLAGILAITPTSYGTIVRLNPNGTFDLTFGSQGGVKYPNVTFNNVALQQQGGNLYLLVSGSPYSVLRFTSTGALDTTFGMSGSVSNALCGYPGQAYSVALDSLGNIYAAGFTSLTKGGSNKIVLTKYTYYGKVDTTFGDAQNLGQGLSGGTVVDFFGGTNNYVVGTPLRTSTDSTGNIRLYLGGTAYLPGSSLGRFALARYSANGTLDRTWGGVGAVATIFTSTTDGATASTHLLQADGKIVQAGHNTLLNYPQPVPVHFALVRFWP
jgi:uncharacterized delta-60 repeat protein